MQENNSTIIYVSSSMEKPSFEKKIQQDLLSKCGSIPIVAVTQEAVNLGSNSINIVVGRVGASGFNMCRQILIGCEAITTKFVISAEADCLYPPDYFTFVPERDDIPYRSADTYLLAFQRDYFYKKNEGSTFAQIVGKEFYIKRLRYLFEGVSQWSVEEKNFPKTRGKKFFEEVAWFKSNPCISMKTGQGMRRYSHSDRTPIHELPYWGKAMDLRKDLYENN